MKQTCICTLLSCMIVLLFSITGFAQSVDKNAKGIWLYHVAPLDRPNPESVIKKFDKKAYHYEGLKECNWLSHGASCNPLHPLTVQAILIRMAGLAGTI
ncbi:MAG: hypothetical protein ABJA79_00680 [Parafilimonas sp.]